MAKKENLKEFLEIITKSETTMAFCMIQEIYTKKSIPIFNHNSFIFEYSKLVWIQWRNFTGKIYDIRKTIRNWS